MHKIELSYLLAPARGKDALIRNPLMDMLHAVRAHGSISKAAKAMGFSYRHVWGALKDWEQTLGRNLIVWDKGQRARLSEFGDKLLWAERQAQARQLTALENQIGTERQVIQQVRSAFASWKASLSVIRSAEAAIAANSLSLDGVRAENGVGTRTILEVLNADQELINSRVQLATSRRNAYVAAFTLIAAMGNAEARDLNFDGVTLYDPGINARAASGSFFDWSGRELPPARSTRTIGTAVQNATVQGPPRP